ncbi:hypothetical protein chiPu_0002264 [Chiloscyllium punctatum]|uniref:Uncharacterized protein n=1 Tax=Chiloscyllium punctatum TaxID=137246 RepID=A0A401S0F3_CHIPU|nr:hypothetical protein [Chiloscyllium punctatum]
MCQILDWSGVNVSIPGEEPSECIDSWSGTSGHVDSRSGECERVNSQSGGKVLNPVVERCVFVNAQSGASEHVDSLNGAERMC